MYLATRPCSVYEKICLEDSYEFHGQIELQYIQPFYDEIRLLVSVVDPPVICIPYQKPLKDLIEVRRYEHTGKPNPYLLPPKEPQKVIHPEEP